MHGSSIWRRDHPFARPARQSRPYARLWFHACIWFRAGHSAELGSDGLRDGAPIMSKRGAPPHHAGPPASLPVAQGADGGQRRKRDGPRDRSSEFGVRLNPRRSVGLTIRSSSGEVGDAGKRALLVTPADAEGQNEPRNDEEAVHQRWPTAHATSVASRPAAPNDWSDRTSQVRICGSRSARNAAARIPGRAGPCRSTAVSRADLRVG